MDLGVLVRESDLDHGVVLLRAEDDPNGRRFPVAALEAVAEGASIPYQFKLPTYGGTDAGAIHLTRGGVLAGVISVPCRYIHSPISTLRLDDLENTIRLVTALVEALPDAVF